MPDKGRYYRVYEFMTRQMGLSGISLQLYAKIFHFSYEPGSEGFFESRATTAESLGVTGRAVIAASNALVFEGLIYEDGHHETPAGRTTKVYRVVRERADAAMTAMAEGGSGEGTSSEDSARTVRSRGEQTSHAPLKEVQPRTYIENRNKRKEESRFAKYE